eukprot:Gb_13541 [translate_table: standard]
MNSQKANPSTSRGRDYIKSTEEEASKVSMEVVMVVEGEDISAKSPTTVKEPIHCWMKSSEESPALIGLGCTTLCRDRVRGAETLLTFKATGKNLFLLSPCHWSPEYKQDSCLRLLETQHFEGMRPFVSRFRGRVCSPYVYRVLNVNIYAWAPWS